VAEDETREPLASRAAQFDGRALLRLGLWSLAACVAVTVAVLVASSESGLRRLSLAISGSPNALGNPQRDFAARETAHRTNEEMQRLSEPLRQVNIDRMRLVARLEAIERHLDDLTGSINKNGPAPPAPESVPPPVESTTTSPSPRGAIAPQPSPAAPAQTAL